MTGEADRTSGVEATRERIVAAAFALFGAQGYARTTTRAVAEAAGVNEVTIFRHFGSKKNLLVACVEAANAQGFSATFARHLTGDYAQDILIMARLQAAHMAKNVDILRVLICDAVEVPEIRDILLAGASGNQALVASYFRRQIENGVVRPGLDPLVLARAFDNLFSMPVFFERVLGAEGLPGIEQEHVIAQLADIFACGTARTEQEGVHHG